MNRQSFDLKAGIHQPFATRSLTMKNQEGSTLIEVLVAVLVLSLGMLGMASLQTRGMQFNQSSYYLSQANIMAVDILDRMRAANANSATVKNFLHGMNDSLPKAYTKCFGTSANCTTSQLAQYELYSWLEDVSTVLPSGKASITEDATGATPLYTVTIQYNDSKADDSTAYGQEKDIPVKQYVYRAEL